MPDTSTTTTLRPVSQTNDHPHWHAAARSPQQGPGTHDASSVPPPVTPARGWEEDVDWHAWFRNLGVQTRALRDILGLTQDQLADLAGVSQGAVSRFERGAGKYTPAAVVFRIGVALARQCRAETRTALAEPLIRLLDDIQALVPVTVVDGLPPITQDPRSEQLHLLFRTAPPRARDAILAILRSFCTTATQRNSPV